MTTAQDEGRVRAAAIAAYIGPEWADGTQEVRESGWLVLTSTAGDRLSFGKAYDKPRRLVIGVDLPVGVDRVYTSNHPRITVAVDRSPEAIGAETVRRMLPVARTWWDEQRACADRRRRYEAEQAALIERLKAASNGALAPSDGNYRPEREAHKLYFDTGYPGSGKLWERGSAEVSNGTVDFVLTVGPDLAERIARLLAAAVAQPEGAVS